MKITTLSRYGLRAAVDLAIHYKDNKPISLKDISKRQGISARYLENIMTDLIKSGIVISKKGKYGGFMLTKNPEHIKVSDIIQSLEPERYLIDCVKHSFVCEREAFCASKQIWEEANRAIWDVFEKYTLKDLADHEEELLKKLNINGGVL